MSFTDLLGRTHSLRITRVTDRGVLLASEPHRTGAALEVPLPRRELPANAREGELLEVFVYLDSEDQPIASCSAPKLELGEVAFLEVTALSRFGAFVDWGLPKELLVPFAEQTRELELGERHPFGLIQDRTGRLAATMRIRELLHVGGRFRLDEWVQGEAWRDEPGVGLFCILERRYLGLLPASEPHRLRRGEAASFRVVHVLADGKVELSLRAHAHQQLADDAEQLLVALSRPGAAAISEQASPELIRARFGLSKKAFKRALGRLLKDGRVALDAHGTVLVRAR